MSYKYSHILKGEWDKNNDYGEFENWKNRKKLGNIKWTTGELTNFICKLPWGYFF